MAVSQVAGSSSGGSGVGAIGTLFTQIRVLCSITVLVIVGITSLLAAAMYCIDQDTIEAAKIGGLEIPMAVPMTAAALTSLFNPSFLLESFEPTKRKHHEASKKNKADSTTTRKHPSKLREKLNRQPNRKQAFTSGFRRRVRPRLRRRPKLPALSGQRFGGRRVVSRVRSGGFFRLLLRLVLR
uniref:Uncharacterized protein n=1 Tax=Sicyonia whispovirus TaxID=2984283 RepID=A0A9C7BR82_9VIRU|nr:MAG: hypothetical protein [Sicyonia whispovirus]